MWSELKKSVAKVEKLCSKVKTFPEKLKTIFNYTVLSSPLLNIIMYWLNHMLKLRG